MRSGFYLLENTLNDCSPSEKRIAEYVLANSQAVLSMNISKLAKEVGGSTAAVVRLCKRLNITGFQELKILLAKDVYSESKDTDYPDFTFTAQDGIQGILEKLLFMNRKNLDTLDNVLDVKNIEKTVQKIVEARFVHIAGIGASGIAALDLHQKLLRIGILSNHEQDSHMQITVACTLTDKDVAVFLSYSGETQEIVRGANLAKESGAYTIGITRVGVSSLSKICDTVIYIPCSESISRHGAVLSKINQLIAVDIIYTGIITQSLDERFTIIEKTRKAVNAALNRPDV